MVEPNFHYYRFVPFLRSIATDVKESFERLGGLFSSSVEKLEEECKEAGISTSYVPPKRRKRVKRKSHGTPNPFQLFSVDFRPSIRSENPGEYLHYFHFSNSLIGITFTEMQKKLSIAWKELPKEKQDEYRRIAAEKKSALEELELKGSGSEESGSYSSSTGIHLLQITIDHAIESVTSEDEAPQKKKVKVKK